MARRQRQRQRQSGVKANAKFYVFLGVIAAAVVAVVYFVTSINTVTVEQGEIRFEAEAPVVLVRDEQLIAEDSYARANLIVREGERVEADAQVADVYKFSYNDKVMDELTEKQNVIEQYQIKALESANDAKLAEIDDGIARKSAEIKDIINNRSGNLLTAERELKDLMTEKRAYLKEAVQSDQMLEQYYGEEAQLQDRVDGWREAVRAPQAGVVSYYFDGLEQTLNANNLQQITMADIEDVLNGTAQPAGQTEDTAAAATPLYRLVNNFKWYILIHRDRPMLEFANDTPYEIGFADYPDRLYEGAVVGYIAADEDYIYVIEVLDDIGSLLNTRRADAKMFTRFEGLRIPEDAIKTRDGVTGVNVVTGREKTFVPVVVKVIRDGSAIVEPAEEGGILMAGQQVEV